MSVFLAFCPKVCFPIFCRYKEVWLTSQTSIINFPAPPPSLQGFWTGMELRSPVRGNLLFLKVVLQCIYKFDLVSKTLGVCLFPGGYLRSFPLEHKYCICLLNVVMPALYLGCISRALLRRIFSYGQHTRLKNPLQNTYSKRGPTSTQVQKLTHFWLLHRKM